ncbi:cytochrome P450 [Xylariaceae sp. FL0255]|nr:cytochrome P450 [Xylariaceae sp. FL0255]
MGVPYVRLPVDSLNVPWNVFQPFPWSVIDRLPFEWVSYPDFVRFSRRGWHFADGSDTHVRLGPVWALVTPVAIFCRRNAFIRPIKEYELLEVFGPCISVAGWDDWARHRKVLAAPFNENVMEYVWAESLRQARGLLRSWLSAGDAGIPSFSKDTRTLSLNVLASSAFRKSYEFRGSADDHVEETGSYRDSLQTVLDNIIPLMIIPHRFLNGPFVPKRWARIGNAGASFQKHMQGKSGSGGLMTSFVHALNTHAREGDSPGTKSNITKWGLTENEIYGNLFVINFAGHDTTANTLAFTMVLLAAHPEVQEWIAEEILAVTEGIPSEQWIYKDLFPVLKRCRAILLETLRCFPPVLAIPKWVRDSAETLRVGDRTLTIPPGTNTTIYVRAVQSHPDYWPDPHTWKPTRWILNPASSKEDIINEELLVPKQDTFLPWSDGPQNCLGKKSSEVEATAVLACLFAHNRIHVKKTAKESDKAAKE